MTSSRFPVPVSMARNFTDELYNWHLVTQGGDVIHETDGSEGIAWSSLPEHAILTAQMLVLTPQDGLRTYLPEIQVDTGNRPVAFRRRRTVSLLGSGGQSVRTTTIVSISDIHIFLRPDGTIRVSRALDAE